VAALKAQGAEHSRIVVMIEGSEESGSPDLPAYIDKLVAEDRIGPVELVVCLDSGAGSYDRLWVTASLRGLVVADLQVSVLSEGVHSGDASGVVPSSFRVARALLSRLENEQTGQILPANLHAKDLDEQRKAAAGTAARTLGSRGMIDCFPFLMGVQPPTLRLDELGLNRWWRPQLEIIGANGLPPSAASGNVLRPSTTLTLSLRLPPTVLNKDAEACLRETLLSQPAPHHARVELNIHKSSQGWAAPPTADWLAQALDRTSQAVFSKPAVYLGEGGSIPFMALLGRMFPKAQFLVTGVLGPGANAHGPQEFLEIDFCQKITACVAGVLASAAAGGLGSNSAAAQPADKKARLEPAALAQEYTRQKDGSKQ
jgi:acetylornithine deacetylase/succinyl-diaminopimelate desuccinylase-like protein